jgi:hypothetical protein
MNVDEILPFDEMHTEAKTKLKVIKPTLYIVDCYQ